MRITVTLLTVGAASIVNCWSHYKTDRQYRFDTLIVELYNSKKDMRLNRNTVKASELFHCSRIGNSVVVRVTFMSRLKRTQVAELLSIGQNKEAVICWLSLTERQPRAKARDSKVFHWCLLSLVQSAIKLLAGQLQHRQSKQHQ